MAFPTSTQIASDNKTPINKLFNKILNRLTGILDVRIKRDTKSALAADFAAQSISTTGTASYGTNQFFSVAPYNEMLLEVVWNNLTTGSGAGLTVQIEAYSSGGQYYLLPGLAVNPMSVTIPTGTAISGAQGFLINVPFGDNIRIGCKCTAAYTSGSIRVYLKLKA